MASAFIPVWLTAKQRNAILTLYTNGATPSGPRARGMRASEVGHRLQRRDFETISPTIVTIGPGPSKCWLGPEDALSPQEADDRRLRVYTLTEHGAAIGKALADQVADGR